MKAFWKLYAYGFFTALVLVLIECNQKGETPGISMQAGIQWLKKGKVGKAKVW